MSKIDPEVLYLILTKVAAKETFYNYIPAQLSSGQKLGTITLRHLAEVYERITGNRIGATLKWSVPFSQLDALLAQCGLPALSVVADVTPAEDRLGKAWATKWPGFGALKTMYRKPAGK